MVWFQCVMCWDISPGTNLHVLKLMWSTHSSHLWEKGMEPAHPICCHASKSFIFGHFCFSKFNNNPLPLCSLSHQNSKVFFLKDFCSVCMWVLVKVSSTWVWCPRWEEEGYWSWGCGDCEPPYLCVRSEQKGHKSGPLQKQELSWASEPSLQLQIETF